MSTVTTATIQEAELSTSAPAVRSVAITTRAARLRNGAALGALAGGIAGLGAGAAGILIAPNLAAPVLLVMGAFFGVFNGALLGFIASVGDQRPA